MSRFSLSAAGKSLIVLVAYYALFAGNGRAQWIWQHPLPQGNPLFAAAFQNTDTGFVAGCSGTLLQTTDGGTTWNTHFTATQNHIRSIALDPSGTGLCAGTNGLLFRTWDHGTHWQDVSPGTPYNLNDAKIYAGSIFFVVGDHGTLLRSLQGGSVWTTIPLNTTSNLYSITFTSVLKGYITGENGLILKTADAGMTWITQNSNTVFDLNDCWFFDNDHGFAVGGGFNMGFNDVVLKTTDGGNTWTEIPTPSETTLFSVFFFNQDTGLACGQFQNIMKTTDGGMTWSYTLEYSFENYYHVCGSPDGTAYIVGGAGSIVKTDNFGNTWKPISVINTNMNVWPEPRSLKSLYFHDADSGFAVGELGGVFTTQNGGNTWSITCIDTLASLNAIEFLSPTTGFINAEQAFFRTQNGGITWERSVVDSSGIFLDMHFTSPLDGLLVGRTNSGNGILASTTNGGLSWNTQLYAMPQASFTELLTVGSSEPGKLFVTGHCFINGMEIGFILKSNDGGLVFTDVYVENGIQISSVDFSSKQTGYACGSNGSILKTTDGGMSWSPMSSGIDINLNAAEMVDSLTAYCCGDEGIIIKTTDGGISWQKQFNACTNLNAINVVTPGKIWVCGQMETILHSETGGSTAIPEPEPGKPLLHLSCFPIPAHESINIAFTIPEHGTIRLKLSTIYGSEVFSSAQMSVTAGQHNLEYADPALKPGVYIVSLEYLGQVTSAKIILY